MFQASSTHGRQRHATGASLHVQAYYDQSHREETIGIYDRTTWDIDAQYHVTLSVSAERWSTPSARRRLAAEGQLDALDAAWAQLSKEATLLRQVTPTWNASSSKETPCEP